MTDSPRAKYARSTPTSVSTKPGADGVGHCHGAQRLVSTPALCLVTLDMQSLWKALTCRRLVGRLCTALNGY